MKKTSKPNMQKIAAAKEYAAKPPTYKDDLTAYYNDVEEAVVVIFGTYEKAAKWFDAHEPALNALFSFAEEKYLAGWSASRAANEWYHLNVAAQPIVKNPKSVTIEKTYIAYTCYKSKPEVEQEVLDAREVRAEVWANAYLSTQL